MTEPSAWAGKMTFEALAAANLLRCQAADGFNHPLESWNVSQWTNAIAGETGEACNYAKKLDRIEEGVRGNRGDDTDADKVRAKLGAELADVVIYADLAARRLGLSLADLVRAKWNAKSEEIGYAGRI